MAKRLKCLPAMWETWVRLLGWKDPLEKEMAINSSIPAWRIPWTEELGGLQSMRSQRVGHTWATILSLFTAALFTLAKIWKQPKCPSASEQIKKMWYTHNGILLSHKKEQNNAVCNNMDRPRDYHTKSERERQISWYHLYVESKTWRKWTYLQARNRLTDIGQTCGCQGRAGWGGMDWEFGSSRCQLFSI